MIRETFSDKYNEEVRIVIRELFNICKQAMKHPGDLLVCQQNALYPHLSPVPQNQELRD